MKTLMMLVLMCASVFAYSESSASEQGDRPIKRTLKTINAAKTSATTHSKSQNLRKLRNQKGHNYYKYANRRSYLKNMGKAMNG